MELPAEVIEARKRPGRQWPRSLFLWGTATDADWKQAEADGCRFSKEGWPRQAARLGWTEENAVGLIWTLQGRRVIAMTRTRAAICAAGGTVTFYRRTTGTRSGI
jgi:hypothetical protein